MIQGNASHEPFIPGYRVLSFPAILFIYSMAYIVPTYFRISCQKPRTAFAMIMQVEAHRRSQIQLATQVFMSTLVINELHDPLGGQAISPLRLSCLLDGVLLVR